MHEPIGFLDTDGSDDLFLRHIHLECLGIDNVNTSYAGKQADTTNTEKVRAQQRIIRRVDSTPKDMNFEIANDAVSPPPSGVPTGVVEVGGKLIGWKAFFPRKCIPLQSFEVALRDCSLASDLDQLGCTDLVFFGSACMPAGA